MRTFDLSLSENEMRLVLISLREQALEYRFKHDGITADEMENLYTKLTKTPRNKKRLKDILKIPDFVNCNNCKSHDDLGYCNTMDTNTDSQEFCCWFDERGNKNE